ncbi:MAG: hypothetical protein JWM85_2261 [Acidimicrobiaceae bacterium]|nr:hypothetical protein [Acidimicrobiaceae bacterium]
MRIGGWRVDGYGLLAGHTVDDLPPGLTIVHGPNEAGKSTLLAFVRHVLFGFPDRRRREDAREPLRGGRHGGALRLVEDGTGESWWLARHADAKSPELTRPDGSAGTEEDLRRLLANADAGLFSSVFAFGLDELASLASLEADDVREHVFSAGVLGAGRSAGRAARLLEARRSELVRPRKEGARANALQARRAEIEREVREARKRAERYPAEAAGYRKLGTEAVEARARVVALRRRLDELERLRRSWTPARQLQAAERELADSEPGERDRALLEAGPELRRLLGECSGHERARERAAELAHQRDAILRRLDEQQAALEDVIGRERCAAALTGGRPTEADVTAAEALAGHHREAAALAAARAEEAGRAARAAERARSAEEVALKASSARATADVKSLRRSAEELGRWVDERDRLESEAAAARRDERFVALESGTGRARRNDGTVLGAILVVVTVLLALAGVLAIRLRAPAPGTLAIASALVVAGLAAYLLMRPPTPPTSLIEPSGEPAGLGRARQEVARLAGLLGLPADAGRADAATARELAEAEQEDRRRLDGLAEQAAVARADADAAHERAVAEASAVGQIAAEMGALAERFALPASCSAGELPALLRRILETGNLKDAGERVGHELGRLENGLTTFFTALERLLTRLGYGGDDLEATPVKAEERAIAALHTLEAECDSVRNAALRREELTRAARAAREALDSAFGAGEGAESLAAELAAGDLLGWQAEAESVELALDEAQRAHEELLSMYAAAEVELEVLRTSDEVATLELELEGVEAELKAALTEWVQLGLARALLERTLDRYEHERQPAVIQRAGALFSQVTDGRYLQLVAREEGDSTRSHGLDALGTTGSRVDSGRLSRGTAEQLYLCVRLALAATFAEQAASLPLLLDDVLVNFDPGRAAAVARALATTAAEHQVLAFTCHPHVVELLREAAPGGRIVELERS